MGKKETETIGQIKDWARAVNANYDVLLAGLLILAPALIVFGSVLLVVELLSSEPDTTVVAGALGLILTQTVALIAVLMRRTSETESEQRLLMESGMKAIELIEDGTPAQNGAALVVLSSLGHHDLALSMLQDLWPKDGVNPEPATVVVDLALRSSNPIHQATGASILSVNGAKTFPDEQLYFMPATIRDSVVVAQFPDEVLYPILSYLIRVAETVAGRGADTIDVSVKIGDIMPPVMSIAGLDDPSVQLSDDPNSRLRNTAALLTQALLPYLRLDPDLVGVPSWGEDDIPFETLEERISEALVGNLQYVGILARRIAHLPPA